MYTMLQTGLMDREPPCYTSLTHQKMGISHHYGNRHCYEPKPDMMANDKDVSMPANQQEEV